MYLSRAALGKELARLEDVPLDADTIVVPVPDTAKAAADAMAFALGVPSVEGLMRNRYVGRTFIEGTADRAAKARLKYTPLPEVLAGKRVLLVEDSIVRSTTMRALVHEIRDRGGAREIHLRVACPPIIAPCYYGIDMSRRDELFATPYIDELAGGVSAAAQERMARELGADSLRYLPVEAIARSVSLSPDRLCRACITGQYPTETGQYLYQIENKTVRVSTRSAAAAGLTSRSEQRTVQCSMSRRVMSSKDRPPLEAILAFEVRQIVEVVFGVRSSSGPAVPESAGSRRSGSGSARSTPRRRSRLVARRPARALGAICATSSSVNTLRFLCRFFHHGSGK